MLLTSPFLPGIARTATRRGNLGTMGDLWRKAKSRQEHRPVMRLTG